MTAFSTAARRTLLAWTCSAFTTFALLGSVGWLFDGDEAAPAALAQATARAPQA